VSGTCHSTSTIVLSAKHSTTNGLPPRYVQGWYAKSSNAF
jgi:hypothetical protein